MGNERSSNADITTEPDTDAETTDDADAETDGGVRAYTLRLELVDEPGELLRALEPIAENGGNLLGIHHERGNITPRGHIPVEVDIECPPTLFEGIVDAVRDAGINVIRAGADRHDREINVVLVGDIVDSDLSDTLSRIESSVHTSVIDLSLAAPDGIDAISSARLRLAIDSGRTDDALEVIRTIAGEKDLCVVEPLLGGDS